MLLSGEIMTKHIYLDYSSTVPPKEGVLKTVQDSLILVGNPSSVHHFGRTIRSYIDGARQQIADYFELTSKSIVFTSGATESNNTLLQTFKGKVIVSAIEHPSILKAREDALICPVSQKGMIDLCKLEEMLSELRNEVVLVSVMLANNETGIIQPLKEVVLLAEKFGALVHCDATQAVGRIDCSILKNIDFVSFSGHKIGALQGIGALIINKDLPQPPSLIRGGGQERFHRAGTENVLGIISLGEAIRQFDELETRRIQALRDELEQTILDAYPDTLIVGRNENRLPHISCLVMDGVKSEFQVMHFDLHGIAVSAGSACSSGKVKTSHVLKAMDYGNDTASCAIRISLGWGTTKEHVAKFVKVWMELKERKKTNKKEQASYG